LVIGKNGVLYGTTSSGGASNAGTVFKLAGSTETVLWSFSGQPDGADPVASLVGGSGGVLYGVTSSGGTSNAGTLFSLAPPASPAEVWTETVLWNFTGGSDGASPRASLVISGNGILYGTTYNGGASNAGTVFSATPPATPGDAWTETVLHSFTGGADGADPVASLAIGKNGVLYGTTSKGGASKAGTVFALQP
jgi:uncharacterized repeat protein (TIGR03803 family)